MNINKISEQILHNWPIKIICLVVAIFLYIFHQTSLVDHKNFVVPLNIVENGQVMHVQKLTDSITLSVKALPEDMSNIHVSDFSAILDLSYLTESGEYEIPIQVNTNDSLKQFETLEIKIKPSATLMVKVEKKITKYIPLEVSVSGEPAYGYKLEEVSVEPSSVAVVGPQSIVSKIDKLYTEKVVISNAEVSFSTETKYFPMNKIIYVPEKGPYKVTVAITQMKSNKLFNDLSVNVINLSENLQIDSSIPTISLTANGNVLFLEDYSPSKNVLQLDLSSVTESGEYELPISVNLPSGLTLENLSLDKVNIKVSEKEILEETENTQVQEE
jgi:YbbR domain-containing protein